MGVDLVKRKTIYGYYGSDFNDFLKITAVLPKQIYKIRALLESGTFSFNGFKNVALAPFESNLAYSLRFMIDCKVSGPRKGWSIDALDYRCQLD